MNTIKRVIYIVVLSVMIVMLSGCVNANYNLTLKNDGYLDVNFSVLFESQNQDEIDTAFLDEIKRRFTDIGYSIKEKSELGMTGFELSKKDIPPIGDGFVDNVSYNVDLLDDIMYNMEFDEKARCNTYELDGNIDLTSFATMPDSVSQKLTGVEYTKLLSGMNLKLSINLEDGEIKKTNSQNVSADKKSAEWVLIPGKANHIQLDAVMGVNRAWKVSMVVVAVVILFIAMFMAVLIRMYKKKNNQ